MIDRRAFAFGPRAILFTVIYGALLLSAPTQTWGLTTAAASSGFSVLRSIVVATDDARTGNGDTVTSEPKQPPPAQELPGPILTTVDVVQGLHSFVETDLLAEGETP